MISKQHLDLALNAWEVARDKAVLEQTAFSVLTQSHSTLMASLRKHGHTWTQAEAEFERMSNAHREALLIDWKDMDKKCAEYRDLLVKFKAQR